MKILTNHLGYEPIGSKHAVVMGNASDKPVSFQIVDSNTGSVAFSGLVAESGPVDRWKDWHFWTLDFDPVTNEGTYYVEVEHNQRTIRSFPFIIQANLLERHTISDVIHYFKAQRCSGVLDHADRHMIFEGDDSGRTVDVHGGWYDATGDYGKHLSHLCFSTYFNPQQTPLVVYSLLKTVEALRERNDPNFKQYLKRLLDEAMYGADYLTRLKVPDGSFLITVSGKGANKAPEDRRLMPAMRGFHLADPEKKDSYTPRDSARINSTFESSYRSGAGVSIAALAMASTYTISGEFANADYLKAAEAAFDYLEAHNTELTNDGKENIVDDYCALLAATELYKATHNERYKAAADRRAQSLLNRQIERDGVGPYWRADDGDRPFFHAADAGLPVVSLLYYLDIAEFPILAPSR